MNRQTHSKRITPRARRRVRRGFALAASALLGLVGPAFSAPPADAEAEVSAEAAAAAAAKKAPARVESPGPKAAPRATGTRPTELVPYVPRSRGKARNTAAGGTRTASNLGDLELAVLAPAEIALTTREQPTLYWYVSEATDARVDVTLADDESIDPLLEVTLPSPIEAGIHALDLAEHGVNLEPGRLYTWNVEVVQDAERRSSSLIASGLIERTSSNATLERALRDARARFAPYALSGIWYDAMAELRTALAADPSDKRLRRQEIALLEQIDLPRVARFVRTQAR